MGSDFDCLTEKKMIDESVELSWDEKRELRRKKRLRSFQEIDRSIPDDEQIQQRRLKAKLKSEERKREKELLEQKIRDEEEARLQRQKKREERRASREFDPAYIERVNAEIMSRIKAPPSLNFDAPPRRRTSLITRRSVASIYSDLETVNGDDLKRSYGTDSEKSLKQQYDVRIARYKEARDSQSSETDLKESTSFQGYGKKKEFNSISQSSISESPENSSVFSEEENHPTNHPTKHELKMSNEKNENLQNSVESDQSEVLNETVAEVETGSEPEVQQELPKLKFEQVPAPGSEADLQAVQAVEPLPEPEVQPEIEPEPEVEPEPEPEPEPVVSKPKYSPREAPQVSAQAQKPSVVPAPKTVFAAPQEEKSQLEIEQEEPQMREASPIPIPEGGLNGVKAKYEQSIDVSKTTTPPPKSPLPEVGSIQDRLQKYSSFPTPASKAQEPENLENQPIKIGKLSDRKSSYLKQFEQKQDSSPSKQKTKTTSSGLKERMKAFESNNRSNLVRRETVTAGERAADIRSRISGWGNFAESNGYQKEQPKVGKINSRLDQYTKSATKKQPAVDQSEAEI